MFTTLNETRRCLLFKVRNSINTNVYPPLELSNSVFFVISIFDFKIIGMRGNQVLLTEISKKWIVSIKFITQQRIYVSKINIE